MKNVKPIFGFWNSTLPSFFLKWWPFYGRALEEEWSFKNQPTHAALFPFVLLGFGFLIGAWHWTYESVLTESLFLMILIVALSFLNGRWGALWWLGYCLGDFLIFRLNSIASLYKGVFSGILTIGLPAIIYYTLLALLVLSIPLLAKLLVQKTAERHSVLNNQVVITLMTALVAGGLVYFWNQAYPLLIRPVWTWSGGSPTVAAIEPIQKMGWILVICAVLASIAKIVIKELGLISSPKKMGVPLSPKQGLLKMPMPVKIILSAVFCTFLLSGLFSRWWDPLILLVVLSFLFCLRNGFFFKLPSSWVRWVQTIPLLIRLVIAIGISLLLANPIHRVLWSSSQDTFLPIIVTFSLSLFLIYLLCPKERPS